MRLCSESGSKILEKPDRFTIIGLPNLDDKM